MSTVILRACPLVALASAAALQARAPTQVPPLINYQGSVAVNGLNFKGLGQFRFALVDAPGTTTYWSNDGTSSAGSEPVASITLPVAKGRYSVLLGDTALPSMSVISASVFTQADLRLRVWFNDGANGSQLLAPDQPLVAEAASALASASGAFQAIAPDTNGIEGAAGIRDELTPLATEGSVHPHLGRGLRDGRATTVEDAWSRPDPGGRSNHSAVWTGSEMIIWGGVWAGALNDGWRFNPTTNTWTAIPIAGAPSARFKHTAVWTDSELIIWGGTSDGSNHLNDGGRYDPAHNCWTAVTAADAPAARIDHTVVWTGNEMVVWGGQTADFTPLLNSGGRYDPLANTWRPVSTTNAPAGRSMHSAVWTGREMIIWNGRSSSESTTALSDGGRYEPVEDKWMPVNTTGAPITHYGHSATWTGSEMIVWGSASGAGHGGRYDPANDRWSPMSTTNSPPASLWHKVVWTDSEILIWGGGQLYPGGRYTPSTDRWMLITTTGAPQPTSQHTAVWTGSEMIVWGGGDSANGFRYAPATDSWIPLKPRPRFDHTAVWTGSEMIVWGGKSEQSTQRWLFGDGARFNPAVNSWKAMSTTGAPEARYDHTAVWTGNEMIVWGGLSGPYSNELALNDGGRYDPVTDTWSTTTTTGAPVRRHSHTAGWTGSEMIIWGGLNGISFNSGGRYNPSTDSWMQVTMSGAPTPRFHHTQVWTGREMIIWGGFSSNPDGARYDPVTDSWTPLNAIGAPAHRRNHAAVWTGREMIVWGGSWGSALNDGGRYNPATDSWAPVATAAAPSASSAPSAVWTGDEMIVWGPASETLSTGGRYDPEDNRWKPVALTAGTPRPRALHTAVWTGREMLIWGGVGPGQTRAFDDTFSYTPGSTDFRILNVARSGESLIVRFPTVVGCAYTLWHSEGLVDAVWTGSGLPPISGTGRILSFTVPITTPGSSFFRVQAAPQVP